MTVEQGTSEEVREQVQKAMKVLSPNGGFILSPVDNVRELTDLSQANVLALIDEWHTITGQ